ncbi:MAG: hypothetical protein ACRDNL_22405 [Spirillospora sp.]
MAAAEAPAAASVPAHTTTRPRTGHARATHGPREERLVAEALAAVTVSVPTVEVAHRRHE